VEGGRWQAVRAGRTRNHRLRLPERDVMHVCVCRCGRAEVSVCSPRVLFVVTREIKVVPRASGRVWESRMHTEKSAL
jgi:hypothetical protein